MVGIDVLGGFYNMIVDGYVFVYVSVWILILVSGRLGEMLGDIEWILFEYVEVVSYEMSCSYMVVYWFLNFEIGVGLFGLLVIWLRCLLINGLWFWYCVLLMLGCF